MPRGQRRFRVGFDSELSELRGWLEHDCPEVSQYIFPLCLSDSGERPLCFDHPKIAIECFPQLALTSSQRSSLFAGYVYASAFYFALDATVDGHSRVEVLGAEKFPQSIWLGQLLMLSRRRLAAALPAAADRIDARLTSALVEAALSLQEEIRFKRSPLQPRTLEEFRSAAGRASSVPLLFRLCADAVGIPVPNVVELALQKFLYIMQLADDLGDWREDLQAKHYTSFLRECFASIGHVASESMVERVVYLEGAYEGRLRVVIDGLDSVVADLDPLEQWKALRDYANAQLQVAKEGLRLFMLEKERG